MILHNHSDTAYLVSTNGSSRLGGYKYLKKNVHNQQIINGTITIIAKLIKIVIASIAEAEVGALYMNSQELIPFRIMCK